MPVELPQEYSVPVPEACRRVCRGCRAEEVEEGVAQEVEQGKETTTAASPA